MKSLELIEQEINHAISKGFDDTSIDENYGAGQMAAASGCYLSQYLNNLFGMNIHEFVKENPTHDGYGLKVDAFPWHPDYDNRMKHENKRLLMIAGAWIARELERIIGEE